MMMSKLTAGALSAVLEGADLRDVTISGHPALDAVYVTVRDAEWRTVPAQITGVPRTVYCPDDVLDAVEWEVRHQLGGISFRWHGRIESRPGRLRFEVDGEAESEFDANRIGLCLLHPQALRGNSLRVRGPSGESKGRFPVSINPRQPYTNFDLMTYSVSDYDDLQIALSGELFEMEDHRNWSDAGWKTYCSPLSQPIPVHQWPGHRVRQSVELSAHSRGSAAGPSHRRFARQPQPAAPSSGPVQLRVGADDGNRWPSVGLGASGLPDSRSALEALHRILPPSGLSHLHVELEHDGDWEVALQRAVAEAVILDVPVDVAIVVPVEGAEEMAAAAGKIVGNRLGRVSVFSPVRHTTDAGAVKRVRRALARTGRSANVGGGSRAHLAELNRGDFDCGSWDFVTYGLTPQVHHTDDRAILGTIPAVSDGIRQALEIGGGLPVVVGPVTLRPRFNASIGAPDSLPKPEGDAPDIDPRQHQTISGVYLAGALTALVGAAAVTIFRTVGPRGIVSVDGNISAAATVFAAFAELTGLPARPVTSGGVEIVALACPIRADGEQVLMITNRGAMDRRLEMPGMRIVRAASLVGGQEVAGDSGSPPTGPISIDPGAPIPPRSVVRLHVRPIATGA